MKKVMLAMVIVLISCGCMPKFFPIESTRDKIDDFNVGQIQTKNVGEPIISQIDAVKAPAFLVENEIKLPEVLHLKAVTLPKGTKLTAEFSYENGLLFCRPNNAIHNPNPICFVMHPEGSLSGVVSCHTPSKADYHDTLSHIKLTKTFEYIAGSMKKELVYNGKSKDTIKIMYREFYDNFAKQAFYQDLNYDMSESKLIGFKGIKIEILEATNSYIKYKIMNMGDI
ncbi:MAG: hypothetical protein WCP33_03120 [Deltaproteobacteria bacterium]